MLLNTLPQPPAMIAPAIGGLLLFDPTVQTGLSSPGVKLAYSLVLCGMLIAGLIRLFFLRETHPPVQEKKDILMFGLTVFAGFYKTITTSGKDTRRL